ncbi:MAG: hypothetical protein WAK12_02675 [Acidimicrobiales bacterium]
MRPVDAESWHLSTNFGNATLHGALFIRDAFHLKPDDDASLPPHLTGDVPNLFSLVPGFDPYEAALAWPLWWERAVEYEGAVALGEFRQSVREGNLRDMAQARAKVFDPPGFASLKDSPSLQSLARAAHREALQWSKYHSSRSNAALQRGTRASVVSKVVWETCASLHVTPARLSATVVVLDVEGSWRSSLRPGLLLCSANVLRKESLFEEYLRETFLENLGLSTAPTTALHPYDDVLADAVEDETTKDLD